MLNANDPERIRRALDWSRTCTPFSDYKTITRHPWATTIRLAQEGRQFFLKILPHAAPDRIRLLEQLSDLLRDDVPRIFDVEREHGFIIFHDHEGTDLGRDLDTAEKRECLAHYGRLQGVIAQSDGVIQNAEWHSAGSIHAAFSDFLTGAYAGGASPGPALADYIDADTRAHFLSRFARCAPALSALLRRSDALPPTINHCDLRGRNVARRQDGSLVFFDWDDALIGPPGLSLHNMFSGCRAPVLVLGDWNDAKDGDDPRRVRALLATYIESLTRAGYGEERLIEGLAGAIFAGTLNYVMSFSHYVVESRRLKDSIGKNIGRRLKDMDALLAALPSAESRHGAVAISGSSAMRKGEGSRDDPAGGPASPPAMNMAPGPQALERWTRSFKEHGTLFLQRAIPPELVEQCHRTFVSDYRRQAEHGEQAPALRVGDKRFMMTVKVQDAFADPNVFAPPRVLPIIHRLLGGDAIIGSMTVVAALPGAKTQRLHKDNSLLFPEAPDMELPCFSLALIIPLIALDELTGTTRVVPGSHRRSSDEAKSMKHYDPPVDIGSCYLLDSRLSHRGLPNRSDRIRPILSVVYQRPWYRDIQNFTKQPPLVVDQAQLDLLPEQHRKLFRWFST